MYLCAEKNVDCTMKNSLHEQLYGGHYGPSPVKTVLEYLFIFLAMFPMAMIVNWIILPQNIVSGGLTGICAIIYFATSGSFPDTFAMYGGSIPVWLTTLVFNSVLLLIAYFTVDWRFCVRTLFGTLTLAMWYRVIPIRTTPLIDDPVSACIVGGLAFGVALGVVMANNGSSGGTDIVAKVVHHYRDISLGRVMIICDLIIIASSYMLPLPEQFMHDGITAQEIADFKTRRILYGLCMTVSYTLSVDTMMNHLRRSVQFFIYSQNHYAEIATAINQNVNRGVTILDGMGWYSKQPMHVVSVLARRHEAQQIIRIVRNIDPNAFVSQANVSGVFGKGFEAIK